MDLLIFRNMLRLSYGGWEWEGNTADLCNLSGNLDHLRLEGISARKQLLLALFYALQSDFSNCNAYSIHAHLCF